MKSFLSSVPRNYGSHWRRNSIVIEHIGSCRSLDLSKYESLHIHQKSSMIVFIDSSSSISIKWFVLSGSRNYSFLKSLTRVNCLIRLNLSAYANGQVLWFCSLIIVCLVLITEIATWWYDHRTKQKNNTLPWHGIEPCTSCFPGRPFNHCTRKECWSFVSFRLMFEGEHFEHNTK